MKYQVMSFHDFADKTLTSKDLDPIYVMLLCANLSQTILNTWLIAYWCLYNAASASILVEQCTSGWEGEKSINIDTQKFWMSLVGATQKMPHGFERRHFRGQKAIDAVVGLSAAGTPNEIVQLFTLTNTFKEVSERVQQFKQFGPWIAWKVADMLSCVCGYPIDFSQADLSMYRDPMMGAALLKHGNKLASISSEEIREVVRSVEFEFKDYPPPADATNSGRKINVQEVETLLCKYKAHVYGHYPILNDTHEISKALTEASSINPMCAYMLDKLKEGIS